jgi:hypothetical protein
MKRIAILLVVFPSVLFALALLLPFFAKTRGGPKDAAMHYARHDVSVLASAFEIRNENNPTNDTIHITSNELYFSCGFAFATGLTTNLFFKPINSKGELLDVWNTPYQVKIEAQPNFIVRSAGPNKNFGDADDIIFNSASNGFVKP